MKYLAGLTTLSLAVVAVISAPLVAAAQQPQERGGLGGVIDILSGILDGGRLQGHVVVNRDTTLVVRGDDGRTYAIDTSQVDPRLRGIPEAGERVTVVLARAREAGDRPEAGPSRGPGAERLVAQQLQLDSASGGPAARKTFQMVQGTVEDSQGEQFLFRTRDGLVVPVDVATIRGLPPLAPKEPATLYYEQGPRHQVVGVWVEPRAVTAWPPPSAPQPPSIGTAPQPSAGMPGPRPGGELQSVHGLIESVDLSGFTLSADDGRRLAVDTAQLEPGLRRDLRPGDFVTVVGRPSADRPNALVAEFVEPDRPARR
jgi:hypothetical protein